MTINQAILKYRLPNPTTEEDLEERWSKVLNYGDKVLLAGFYHDGMSGNGYFGAVYEHLDGDKTCEGALRLKAASENCHFDDGHAIRWAMGQA